MKGVLLIFYITHSLLSFTVLPDQDVFASSVICKSSYCEFETSNVSDYQFASFTGELEFKVRAAKEVYIVLANELTAIQPLAELCIGCNDNQVSILYQNETESKKFQITANTPNILSPAKYNGFWIRLANEILLVGRQNERDPLLAWHQTDALPINYLGFQTHTGEGLWTLGHSKCWIPCENGHIPDHEAVLGGQDADGSNLYVGRFLHNGEYIIGKVSPQHRVVYFASEGKEYGFPKYEALTAKNAEWKRFSDEMKEKELLQATNAGQFGNKTILYVARMNVHNRFTPGYFNYKEKKCFTSYGLKQMESTECDILFSTC